MCAVTHFAVCLVLLIKVLFALRKLRCFMPGSGSAEKRSITAFCAQCICRAAKRKQPAALRFVKKKSGQKGLNFMKKLDGTKTQANLMAAFAGESQARNKYTFYAAQAKQEGYEQIGNIFLETANNEKEHAEIWFKRLQGGTLRGTAENLLDSAQEVKRVQDETGRYIACLEEIAYQRGYISHHTLMRHAADLNKTLYGRYLECL